MSYAEAMLVHSDNDRKLQQALHAEKQAMQAEQALREAQVVGALRQELSTATDLLRRVVVNTASEFTPTFGLFDSNPLVGYVRPGPKNETWMKQQKKIHVWPLNCRHQHFVCNGQLKVDGRRPASRMQVRDENLQATTELQGIEMEQLRRLIEEEQHK